MTDKELLREISNMSIKELLAYVLLSPTDLTDSYYSKFCDAIYSRAKELSVY